MILDIARNCMGFKDATHAEYDPYASHIFISKLECSLRDREMQLDLLAGSKLAELYQGTRATEKYYCNFGVNPEYVEALSDQVAVVASDSEGELRAIEIPEHDFWIGTLYVPQALSQKGKPHPIVNGFLQTICN